MTYGEIRTTFLTILNRSDCTNAIADEFITQGIARSQRILKLPSQETIATLTTVVGTPGIDLPADLLRIIDVYIDDDTNNRSLDRISLKDYLNKAVATDIPLWYVRRGTQILVNPAPSATTVIKMLYMAGFTFTDDNDEPTIASIAPDLFIYGGLCYAADKYLDDRLTRFEQRYQQIIAELQGMADEDELMGGAVQTSPYAFPDEDY
jgi:hypothetical protein